MTLPNVPEVPSNELIDELQVRLHSQPWYRRFANTVTAAVGALSIIVWLLAANGIDLPDWTQTAVGSALAVLTVLGVLKTKNGVTPRGVVEVTDAAEYVGQHRRTEE